MGPPGAGCRLSWIHVRGDRCLVLGNDAAEVAVNLDHGAHLYRLLDRRTGIQVLHRDPRGSRHYRVGGWYELFPNAGAPCRHQEFSLSRAGDIQHRPFRARVLETTRSRIQVELTARSADMPFRVHKRITVTDDLPGVLVQETITNLSGRPLAFLWGQHITFGRPFLAAGTRVVAPGVLWSADPATETPNAPYAPRATGPLHALPRIGGGTVDLTSFPDHRFSAMLFSGPLAEAAYSVHSPACDLAVDVRWDGAAFPRLWLWATNGGSAADPGLVAMAIEPQASEVHGLANAVRAGRAPVLDPGASRTGWVQVRMSAAVQAVDRDQPSEDSGSSSAL
jgi:galactose mutarotase-like enzyme